uniref:Uncharacterized protein n=1 Tax=Caenorhabditis japonica TaxID=281687 RepID=A0A8R1DWW6_CAEJA
MIRLLIVGAILPTIVGASQQPPSTDVIDKVLPKLSTKSQQKLIRIVMTQQNQTLSVGEKERILRHISASMDMTTKSELARWLTDKDLFSLIY